VIAPKVPQECTRPGIGGMVPHSIDRIVAAFSRRTGDLHGIAHD
jgi:hypothetical protein